MGAKILSACEAGRGSESSQMSVSFGNVKSQILRHVSGRHFANKRQHLKRDQRLTQNLVLKFAESEVVNMSGDVKNRLDFPLIAKGRQGSPSTVVRFAAYRFRRLPIA